MKNIITIEKSKLKLTNGKQTDFSGKGWFTKPNGEYLMKRDIMHRFMRPLRPYLKELEKLFNYWPAFDHVSTENTNHGFKGTYPTLRIDYSKVILTKGKLPNPAAISVSPNKPGKLVFRWTDSSGFRECLPSDLLYVAIFNCKSRRWIFKADVAERSASSYSMDATLFKGKPVQVYAGFISEDSNRISTSLFLGKVKVF